MDAVRARSALPLVTWEPWAWGGGVNQPAYSLDRIAAGDFDPRIREWGQALAAWGKPVMIRFAHEMNGDWYPWAEGVNGNRAGDYVAAWQHVHDVVAATGASNVQWVWSPTVPYWGSTGLAGLYPGTAYLAAHPDVMGFVWFHLQKEADWRINSSDSSAFALKSALLARRS